MKPVSSLECGSESAHDVVSAAAIRTFRGEKRQTTHPVKLTLLRCLEINIYYVIIIYFTAHAMRHEGREVNAKFYISSTLQSLQCCIHHLAHPSNICARTGDFPSAPIGRGGSNLRDDPVGNVQIFPPSAPRGLRRGALEQKKNRHQTNGAMKKHESTHAVFLMATIRCICNRVLLPSGGQLTSKTNQRCNKGACCHIGL